MVAFLMPLEDGEYDLTFSPYIKPNEEPDLGDYMISGWLIDQESGEEVESFMVTEQNASESVTLKEGRVYRLDVTSMKQDVSADLPGFITFPPGMAVAILANEEVAPWLNGVTGVIWVPSGCKEILCVGNPRLSLISPNGKRTDVSSKNFETDGLSKVPVGGDEDDQPWTVGNQTFGKVFFGGEMPPLINLNQSDLLLPSTE